MSHVTNIDVIIKDLDALKKAAAILGLEFRENQKTYRWFGQHVGDYKLPDGFTKEELGRCEHAIGLPNNNTAYEVGVVRYKPGTFKTVKDDAGVEHRIDVSGCYTLQWDFWAGGYGLQAAVGDDANKLRQEYAAAVAMQKLKKKGFRVQRSVDAQSGKVILKATR